MDPAVETESDLEAKARAQAEAIAQAQALALASSQRSPMQIFFQNLGRTLRLSKEQVSASVVSVQKPGRELLLWQMKQSADIATALDIAFTLFEDARFINTVPLGRDCPVVEFNAQRKWNEAAAEWSKMGGGTAETWLRCDRKLVLRRQGSAVALFVSYKDLCVRFDQKAGKLVPVRVELVEPIDRKKFKLLLDKFPSLNPTQLAEGLRVPTRAFARDGRRGVPDAYVHQGPLVANLEVFFLDRKKKKEDKDDPGKGFISWLSGLLKTAR